MLDKYETFFIPRTYQVYYQLDWIMLSLARKFSSRQTYFLSVLFNFLQFTAIFQFEVKSILFSPNFNRFKYNCYQIYISCFRKTSSRGHVLQNEAQVLLSITRFWKTVSRGPTSILNFSYKLSKQSISKNNKMEDHINDRRLQSIQAIEEPWLPNSDRISTNAI